jgi:hypothetical protein
VPVNDLIGGRLWKNGRDAACPLAGSGQALHEFLFPLEKRAKMGARRAGFDAALDIGKLPFGPPVVQGLDAAFGLFPSKFVGLFEEDLEEHAAVAFFQGSRDFRGLHGLARKIGGHQSGHNPFRFEAEMQLVVMDSLRQFVAEAFALGQHPDQPSLDGFRGAADQFGLYLHFASALGSSFAECEPEDRLI